VSAGAREQIADDACACFGLHDVSITPAITIIAAFRRAFLAFARMMSTPRADAMHDTCTPVRGAHCERCGKRESEAAQGANERLN
jgi:hypothetical protein